MLAPASKYAPRDIQPSNRAVGLSIVLVPALVGLGTAGLFHWFKADALVVGGAGVIATVLALGISLAVNSH